MVESKKDKSNTDKLRKSGREGKRNFHDMREGVNQKMCIQE